MPSQNSGRIRRGVEALASRITQTVETITRNSRISIKTSDVDDIDPPEDIDEYHQLYVDIGIIHANINQFVRDVWEPGMRVEADDDQTKAYFMGGDEAPEDTPAGGFLDNCGVMAEKRIPFYPFGKTTSVQRWTRGTVLVEYTKPEGKEDEQDAPITGFKHIRPETVSARTYANTNILLDPEDTETADELTKRDEAAAYVQYDDNSIVGRRSGGLDKDEIALSQNDVLRQVLNQDIGGEDPEDGVFGVPVTAAISDDAEEYREIKRDRARAIKTKAYGVWSAQFNTEVTEAGDETILEEWSSEEQNDWVDDVDGLGPGDIVGHDGSIDLDQWEPQVPDLDDPLKHYVGDILAPLPAPKYATAFGDQVNQHVSDRQENSYQDTIQEERQYQERSWTQAFREVAERHPDLDPSGLKAKIQPKKDDSPITSMDDDAVERLKVYSEAVKQIEMVTTLTEEEKRELLLQLPPTPELGSLEDADVDESDPDIEEMAQDLTGNAPTSAEADD